MTQAIHTISTHLWDWGNSIKSEPISLLKAATVGSIACSALTYLVNSAYFPLSIMGTVTLGTTSCALQAIHSIRERRFESRLGHLEEILNKWVKDRKCHGNKKEAAWRILEAARSHSPVLNLTELGLETLPDCFHHLHELKMVNLSHNRLTYLPPSLLKNSSLRELNIIGNTDRLLALKFPNKNELVILKTASDELKIITKELESWKTESDELKIITKELESWKNNDQIGGDKEVAAQRILDAFKNKNSSLDLRGLELTLLPSGLHRLSNLTELNVSRNELASLRGLERCTQLTELNVSQNNLTSLRGLESCSQLTKLDVYTNNLTSLRGLKRCTQLTELNVSQNNLTSLRGLERCTQLRVLHVHSNKLTSLQGLQSCSQLTVLNASHNKLTSLRGLERCTQLTKFNVSHNNLTSLQGLQSCSQLTVLTVSNNKLTSLQGLESYSQLTELYVSDNNLTSLQGIESCSQLKELYIEYNPALQELPLSLGNNAGITFIDTEGTAILEANCNQILDLCRAMREKAVLDRLPELLKLWEHYAGLPSESLSFIQTYTDEEKVAIYEWLTRLAKTKDFGHDQKALAKVVCSILVDTQTEPFKSAFFDQVKANNTCCEDRAAMALNELYVSWRLMCPKTDLSKKEALKLLEGAGKTLALRAILNREINAYEKKNRTVLGEDVEIFLYYETALRERLGSLTAVKSMSYGAIGKRDWISEAKLIEEVNATYLNHVVSLPAFDTLFAKDLKAKDEILRIQDKGIEKLEGMGERPAGEDLDPRVLNWEHQIAECEKKCNASKIAFKMQWFKDQLKSI